jgi:transposase
VVLRADTPARRTYKLALGKRLLFSTRQSMSAAEVLATYNRDKQQVEDDFRTLKSPDLIRFAPVRHWTDSKIRVYALVCVLALLVIKLMVRKAQAAGIDVSQSVLATELSDIREAYILYGPNRVQRQLTEMSRVQHLLYDALGLAALAPSSEAAHGSLPLQTREA